MTTDQRIENLEKGLASARRFNRWLPTCAAVCLGMIFAWGFFAQPGRLGTALAEVPTTAKTEKPTTNPTQTTSDVLKSAANGAPSAQVQLGWMYYQGKGVPQDYQKALVWFRKAAEQGDAEAQRALGIVYSSNNIVPRDDQQAFMWYQKAAEQGNSAAQETCGYMCLNGVGVAKDTQQALKWYVKASEQGSFTASLTLGRFYEEGKVVARDYQQAVKWFLKSVEQGSGSPDLIKHMYENGTCSLEDYARAVKLLQNKAEQGNALSQLELAGMYLHGDSVLVPQDHQQAIRWYLKLAEQGGSMANVAKLQLGRIYSRGDGVSQDYQKALKWFREIAEQKDGDPSEREMGMLELGWMYREGKGVTRDCDEAIKWFRKAAEHGNPLAQKELDKMQDQQEVIKLRKAAEQVEPKAALNAKPPDKAATKDTSSESVQLLMKKAEGGDVVAMYRLGVALREGILAKRDDAQAEKWLKTAAGKGNAEAMYELSRLYVELNQKPNDGLYAKQADYWRHEAEKLGHHEAVVNAAANMALTDPKKGFEMMKAAALKGNVEAYALLASYYEKGTGCEKNQVEALRLLTLGAAAGDTGCLVSLGQMQEAANHYSAAFEYYQRAASLGDVFAIAKLVECYEEGLGVQKDEVAAKDWLERMLIEGRRSLQNATSLYYSGEIERSLGGKGGKTDKARVFQYYAAAADRCNDALFELGRCYYVGYGTIPNPAKAVDCIRRAADAEVPKAMTFLGMLYRGGKGVEQNHNKAVELFSKAAEKGDSDAMVFLAQCYDNGEGVMKRTETATTLLEKAAALGNDGAKSMLKDRQKAPTSQPR